MTKRVSKKPRSGKLLTRREIAQKHDVHLQTVTKWEQAGLPVKEPGRKGKPSLFDPDDVARWLKAREEAAKRSGVADLTHEKALRERAQRIATEQRAAIHARELIPRKEAEKALADEILRMRSTLLAWEQTLADRFARAYELEGLAGLGREIRAAVEGVLEELAKVDDLEARPAAKKKAAKKSKRKPARRKKKAAKKSKR